MRGTHWAAHVRGCEECSAGWRKGRVCRQGRIVLSGRWWRTVPEVPVSRAAQTEINILRLITGPGV